MRIRAQPGLKMNLVVTSSMVQESRAKMLFDEHGDDATCTTPAVFRQRRQSSQLEAKVPVGEVLELMRTGC